MAIYVNGVTSLTARRNERRVIMAKAEAAREAARLGLKDWMPIFAEDGRLVPVNRLD